MRALTLAAASALALSAPTALLAQDEAVPDASATALADRLSDPAEQERMAGMLEAMGHILLNLPIGQLVGSVAEAAGEDSSSFDRDATLAEMAGPKAEEVPGEIAERVPQMMGMLAGLMHGLEELRPALEQMSDVMREHVDEGKIR